MVLSCDISSPFGDNPQSLIDETVELVEECLPVAFTGDADAIADCDERGKDLEKRLDAVFADMSDEEKAEWEKKAEAAFTKAFENFEGGIINE